MRGFGWVRGTGLERAAWAVVDELEQALDARSISRQAYTNHLPPEDVRRMADSLRVALGGRDGD